MLKLPARLPVSHSSPVVECSVKNIWGTGLKVAIRECAKQFPEYFMPVVLTGYENKPLAVKTDSFFCFCNDILLNFVTN